MREPIWWIRVTTFCRVCAQGSDYFAIPRGDVRTAWFVATVVADACRRIRADA